MSGLRTLLWPRKDYYVIPSLFAANVLMFALMAFQLKTLKPFSPEQLIQWGGIYGPGIREGQWFRLVSGIFIHGEPRHLVANLYGLIFAGMIVEFFVGPVKTAGIYFIAGIAASLGSVIMHPATVSVGASGAIFGLWGFMIVGMTIGNFRRGPAMLPVMYFALYIGLNLLIGAVKPHIDNAAHIVGLICGAILWFFFAPQKKRKKPAKP